MSNINTKDSISNITFESIDDILDQEILAMSSKSSRMILETTLVLKALSNKKDLKILKNEEIKSSDLKDNEARLLFEDLLKYDDIDDVQKLKLIDKHKNLIKKAQLNKNIIKGIRVEYCIFHILKYNNFLKIADEADNLAANLKNIEPLFDDQVKIFEESLDSFKLKFDNRIIKQDNDNINDIGHVALQHLKDCQSGSNTFCTWGIKGLDSYIYLRPHCCYFIGALPGVGKTAFAISCIIGQLREGKNVALWCGEMTATQIYLRFLSQIAGVKVSSMETKKSLTPGEFERVSKAVKEMSKYKKTLHLRCGEDLEMNEISSWIKKIHVHNPLDCVWLDYFTDIQPTIKEGFNGNRYEAMADVARDIKTLKKELDVPIVTLAQLVRSARDRRPFKTDIAESAVTERIADGIILIDRPIEGKDTQKRGYKWGKTNKEAKLSDLFGNVALVIDKNRYGPTSTPIFGFDQEYMKFTEEIPPPMISSEDIPVEFN